MPSSFPGMDPYIESPAWWPTSHNSLASEIHAEMNRVLSPRYVALLTSCVSYEALLDLYRVEIRTTATQELVTAIEILSPSNKRPGQEAALAYARKRRRLLRSSAHLMEIDLLRGGQRPPLEQPVLPAPYYVVLSRAYRRPVVEVWPVPLQEPLPLVPVSLLAPDPDAPLDLGAILRSVYDRCAFGRLIDYRQLPPPPPLSPEEAAWVEALLHASLETGEAKPEV